MTWRAISARSYQQAFGPTRAADEIIDEGHFIGKKHYPNVPQIHFRYTPNTPLTHFRYTPSTSLRHP